MLEIEQKYRISDLASFTRQLQQLDTAEGKIQHHVDTYFQHPCRNFAETDETVRIRRIDGQPLITYKGPKEGGPVKVREELEWSLAPGDHDGSKTETLLQRLGFQVIAHVEKTRRPFTLPEGFQTGVITIDDVKNLGFFVEIEVIAPQRDDVQSAKSAVLAMAARLGLRILERKSYLSLLLESSK